MRIRRARIDDSPRLWGLRLEMLADSPLAYLDTLDRALARGLNDYADRVAAWTTDPDRALFVAEENGQLAGHLGAFAEGRHTSLVMVYVTPSRRGGGVLRGLVDSAAEWSRAGGRGELLLEVVERNIRAVRAYAKLGFVDTGRRNPHPYLPIFIELTMTRPA
jgi:GNAT superfamily N-acetyltransferase